MKTAFITDIHFGARSNSRLFLDNQERFYREFFFPTLEGLGIKVIVNLGDTWESRTALDPLTLSRSRDFYFDEIERRGLKQIMIMGNHDVRYRSTNEVNMVEFLERMYPNTTRFVRTHEVVDLGVPVGLVSWINNANLEESLEWIAGLPAQGVKHLGGHFEIKEFEMTKGQYATHGLDRKVFDGFDAVWSGHFHVRSKQGAIQYLSNPSQTNWGDVGLDKGFHVFDSETLEMTPYNNPFEMYKEITWGVDKATPEDFRGKYGRIYVPAFESVGRAELDIFVDACNEISPEVRVVEGSVVLADASDSEEDPDKISTQVIAERYIEEVAAGVSGVNPEVLKEMFRDLLSEATSLMEIE